MYIQFEGYQNHYSHLNGHDDMHIKRIDLCRHTMQVGYKNKSSFLSSSIYKNLELFFMVMANVNYRHGELELKDECIALDQSEKVCISYQLGQGLTKAVAEKFFNVLVENEVLPGHLLPVAEDHDFATMSLLAAE